MKLRLCLCVLLLGTALFTHAQLTLNSYSFTKNLSAPELNATVEFGTMAQSGQGTYGRVRVTTHTCNQLFITEFEVYGTIYAGSSTGWVQVPVKRSSDWNGAQNMALDVRLAATNAPFEFRLRRLSGGGCPGVVTTFSILVETNTSFTEKQVETGAVTPPEGYLGQTSGWQFPVIADRFQASKQGIFVLNNGNVGIGTVAPSTKLAVNGEVLAKKVRVSQDWADYVFDSSYRLRPLAVVDSLIKVRHHLPDMPSAAEVEAQGLDLGGIIKQQQVKIEELTLYLIQQQKLLQDVQAELQKLKKQ